MTRNEPLTLVLRVSVVLLVAASIVFLKTLVPLVMLVCWSKYEVWNES